MKSEQLGIEKDNKDNLNPEDEAKKKMIKFLIQFTNFLQSKLYSSRRNYM